MIANSLSLKELIQPLLTCSGNITVGEALDLITQHPGQPLALVNDRGEPLGLVSLSYLVGFLNSQKWFDSKSSKRSQSAIAALKTPLQALSPTILQPLTPVPAIWALKHFLAQVRSQQPTNYAVVNSEGQILGLLDSFTVLQQLALQESEPSPPIQPDSLLPLPLALPLLSEREDRQSCTVRLEDILLQRWPQASASKDRLPFSAALNVGTSSLPLALFHSWVELLDHLPLPVMLQTSSGQVLMQNSLWSHLVGALSDPAYLRQEAAPWLEGTETSPPSSSEPSLCHIGSTPGTCVCVCALKNGQEQVLQFVKIPLGTLLPNWQVNWSDSGLEAQNQPDVDPHLAGSTSSPDGFRLATLTSRNAAHPDKAQSAGEPLWLVLAQDLTEQQQLARELTAKNADLVQLNRLKDEFLACISHELKTPLTAVLGLSTLLKDQTLGELNNRQVRYAQLIYQSSRHLMAVVNDILDLTRIETGQLELLFEPVNIQTVCNRAFEQAKQVRMIEHKTGEPLTEDLLNAQFSLEIEPGLNILVADEIRLRQMLLNLLSNALKFSEVGHEIGLKVTRWGGWIAFTVWDTGIGIAAEKQHLVFQKFQQLENPLTRQFEGAGLGLVLTRRLARLHGGDVTFLSQEGQGSQFTILLPPVPPEKSPLSRFRENQDEAEVAQWTARYPGGRVSLFSQNVSPGASLPVGAIDSSRPTPSNRLVLLVETAPPCIELLTDQLTGLGYQVVVARSGTEAIEKVRRLQPCVILLNPVLPMLSGWDVLTLLKSKPDTQSIPVVVTAMELDKQQTDRNQADGFLSLPVSTATLQQTLQQVLMATASPPTEHRSSANPTILYFHFGSLGEATSSPEAQLTQFLQQHHCRILESDDLGQAELLVRVWQPKIILLDRSLANPALFLQQFKYYPGLTALPLVTLDAETTRLANQIPGLQVFPCLASTPDRLDDSWTAHESLDYSTLLQVIQVAAGCVWQPRILAIDPVALSLLSEGTDSTLLTPHNLQEFPQESEWLQALMQYLQTAGFRGLLGQSWQEVLQQVQSQGVDLLLVCWTDAALQPAVLEKVAALKDQVPMPPVLVLDHREPQSAALPVLPEVIGEIATQVLTPPIAMTELLAHIHAAIDRKG